MRRLPVQRLHGAVRPPGGASERCHQGWAPRLQEPPRGRRSRGAHPEDHERAQEIEKWLAQPFFSRSLDSSRSSIEYSVAETSGKPPPMYAGHSRPRFSIMALPRTGATTPPPFRDIILMLLAVDFSSSLMLLMKTLVSSGSDMNLVPLLSTYSTVMTPKLDVKGISIMKTAERPTPIVMLRSPPPRRAMPAATPLDTAMARLDTKNSVPKAADSTPNFLFT